MLGTARFRDLEKHIEVACHSKFISLEWEGQFFKTPEDFNFVRMYIRKLNSSYEIKPWKATRVDPAIDILDVTPYQVLPINDPDIYFSFKAKISPIRDSKSGFDETIYLESKRRYCIRAYSKQTEIISNLARKKGFYDLNAPEFKNRHITRLEVELIHQYELEVANALINSDLDFTESEFVDACLKAFTERKNIRLRGPQKKKDKWPLLWSWELLKTGRVPENLPTFEFQKVTQKQDVLMRFLTATINRAEKEGFEAEQVQEFIEVALERRKKSIKPPAA